MKILSYNSSARGSGQFVRSLKIAKIITSHFQKPEFLIIAGNSVLDQPVPERTKILRIPEIRKSVAGEYLSHSDKIATTFADRKLLIESTVRHYNPDVFLIDSRPSGLNGELSDIIHELKFHSKCKIVLMLRDIVDDPEMVKNNWREQNVYYLIKEIFDKVIIFGNKETYNAVEQYNLTNVGGKVFYVGYLNTGNDVQVKGNSKDDNEIHGRILITVGGGFDGDTIINTVCAHINDFSAANNHKYSFRIVLGSNSPLDIHTLYHSYPNIVNTTRIISHSKYFGELISEAELVISMCGYNTATELTDSHKKIIFIPRTHSGREQLIRSDIFANQFDGIWLLPENELTTDNLGALINQAMISPQPKKRRTVNNNEDLIAFFKYELKYEG